MKAIKRFIFFSGILLLITAAAKFVSAAGSAKLLHYPDPILSVAFQHLFWLVGGIELVVAGICFFSKRVSLQVGLIAWLTTNFAFYRFAWLLSGYHETCPCLGHLTDALHVPPQVADTAMKIILAYLLAGSYGTLFWLWRQKRKGLSVAA